MTDLVDNLRAQIARPRPPPGCRCTWPGSSPSTSTSRSSPATPATRCRASRCSSSSILLLLIFRSLLAPLITVIPALLSVAISGPIVAELANHGLKVSQLVPAAADRARARGGHRLRPVPGVPGPREPARAGPDPKDAVVNALTKVGESITFSAFTVIAALLSLLFATFQIYSNLGIPLAIGIGVMLLAGLTLLPALLAIFGRAAFWPSKPTPGTASSRPVGPDRRRGRQAPGGRAAHRRDRVRRAVGRGRRRTRAPGSAAPSRRPAGTDSAAGHRPAEQVLPVHGRQPDQPRLQAVRRRPGRTPRRSTTATTQLDGGRAVHRGDRAAQPGRRHRVHAGPVHRSCTRLGSGPLPATAPADARRGRQAGITPRSGPRRTSCTGRPRSSCRPDGKTIQFQTVAHGRRPVHHGGAQRGARGPHRGGHGGARRCTPPTTAWRARRRRSTTSARSPTATWRT